MLSSLSILASEGPNSFWLPSDLDEVIWGSLSFLVVALLLVKFAKAPTVKFLSGRIAGIKATLDEAEQARLSAEAHRDSIKAALADSDAEAAKIIQHAHADADQLGRDTTIRAERDAQQVTERSAADLVTTRQQTESDLAGELSRLSLGAAERVVESSLDDQTQQRLIQAYIDQVGSQN